MKKTKSIQMTIVLLGIVSQIIASSLINFNKGEETKTEKESFGNPYDMDYTMPEKLSYEDTFQNLKIVTIEQEGTLSKHLMYKIDRHTDVSNFNVPYTYDHYMDLEDDTQLLSYKNTEVTVYMMPNEKVDIKETEYAINISNGEKGIVLAEEGITPYLMQLNKVQSEYDVDELISIYSEEIKPQLEENEKQKKPYTYKI